MLELIAQGLKAFNGFFSIFTIFQSKEQIEAKNIRQTQEYQDSLEKNLKEGNVSEIDKKLG